MPAYITHSLFSHMALLALQEARHPLAVPASRHAALFRVAGIAGCDIQCMPYQTCDRCAAPYRHNQGTNRRCAVCGGETLQDFSVLISDKRRIGRVDIERELYRNTHLVLGRYRGYGVDPKTPRGTPDDPFPSQVVAHLRNTLRDAPKMARPKSARSNFVAFVLGWFSHVVSDALFKGLYPETARVDFFGRQYHMDMLPAAETITFTDMAYDFGVCWPGWHGELLDYETDGGALRHLAMGNEPACYDARYWTENFGKPDSSIGRVLDAVPRLNRKWLHAMYTTPDYSAASPRLDQRKLPDRSHWTFEGQDLGQLRRYAFTTGWYDSFIRGVDVYLRAVNAALAAIEWGREFGSRAETAEGGTGAVSWTLWRQIITEARTGKELPPDWGSSLQLDDRALSFLRRVRRQAVRMLAPDPATDYQRRIVETLKSDWNVKPSRKAAYTLVIGPPAFNEAAAQFICREDVLRLKYDSGLAGIVRVNSSATGMLIAGLSDFGDFKLARWISEAAVW